MKKYDEIIVFFPATTVRDGVRTEHSPRIVEKRGFDGFGGVYRTYILKSKPIPTEIKNLNKRNKRTFGG